MWSLCSCHEPRCLRGTGVPLFRSSSSSSSSFFFSGSCVSAPSLVSAATHWISPDVSFHSPLWSSAGLGASLMRSSVLASARMAARSRSRKSWGREREGDEREDEGKRRRRGERGRREDKRGKRRQEGEDERVRRGYKRGKRGERVKRRDRFHDSLRRCICCSDGAQGFLIIQKGSKMREQKQTSWCKRRLGVKSGGQPKLFVCTQSQSKRPKSAEG